MTTPTIEEMRALVADADAQRSTAGMAQLDALLASPEWEAVAVRAAEIAAAYAHEPNVGTHFRVLGDVMSNAAKSRAWLAAKLDAAA